MYGSGPTGREILPNLLDVLDFQRGQFLDLYLQKDQLGGRPAVTVMGDVDMSNSHLLRDYLSDQIHSEPQDLYLNLAELSFIDSTGLSVLLNTRKLLQSFDCSLVLVSPSPAVESVLAVTGLDAIFEVDAAGKAGHSAAKGSA